MPVDMIEVIKLEGIDRNINFLPPLINCNAVIIASIIQAIN